MSYYRRGYSWEQIHYLAAPMGGWNPDTNGWDVAESQAMQLDNFLIRPGKIVMRNPLFAAAQLSGSPINYCGHYFLPGGRIVLGAKSAAAPAALVAPWDAPRLLPQGTELSYALSTPTYVRPHTVAAGGTTAVVQAGISPGPRWASFDGYVYGLAYPRSTDPQYNDTLGTYLIYGSGMYIAAQGGNLAYVNPTISAGAPLGGFDIKVYQERIWILAGTDNPGGVQIHSPTTLYYTNPIKGGGGDLAADWKDPISASTNHIKIDGNQDDYGVGLAVTRAGLLVLRSASVWLLRGSTASNYVMTNISREVGCVDNRSIVECDHGVYFMSNRGLMLCTSTAVVEASGSARYTLGAAVGWASQYPNRMIQAARLSDGSIQVSIGTESIVSGSWLPSPVWSGVYDPASRAWTRITSSLWSSFGNLPPYLLSNPERNQLYAVDTQNLVCEEDPALYTSVCNQGMSSVYGNGYDTTLSVTLGQRIQAAIPAVWSSRLVPVVGTTTLQRKWGQARRWFLDESFTSRATNATTWEVDIYDSHLTSLASTVLTNSAGYNTPLSNGFPGIHTQSTGLNYGDALPLITREGADFTNEVADFYFKIAWTDTARPVGAAPGVAEIYGVGVEFQPSRDLRGT